MKLSFRKAFVLILAFFSFFPAFCCTSAIFTGKCTPDGRPLMWKHRDTDNQNNCIRYFAPSEDMDIKYGFIALMNSNEDDDAVWTGTNSEGFSIMNTTSYNLHEGTDRGMDKEGKLMFTALSKCRNIKDFEEMLSDMPRPIGVEANFGIIDAEGGAAYYEVNNIGWIKVDANDPEIAPQGYLIYTNYSYTGTVDKGSGYERYASARQIIERRWIEGGDFTPQWIFSNLSRSYYHSILGYDLACNDEAVKNGWFIDQDFIPRRISSASIVLKGVKKGENPLLTVMWTILGYPPCGIAVPMLVAGGDILPEYMTAGADGTSEMCNMALARKTKVFPLKRGNGEHYFRISEALRYIEVLAPYEAANFEMTDRFLDSCYKDNKVEKNNLKHLYSEIRTGSEVK